MKVWFKRGLFSLVVLAIVTVVGGAIFLLTFNPNSYKQKLADIVQKKYQRTLKIEGDIELSLFPRIGLSVQRLSLSDRNSEDPFASLESARFAVALWPLINNRLVVDHVAVTGFKAWIVRDENGKFNFDDLLQAPPAIPAPVARSGVSLLPAAQAAEPPAQDTAPQKLPVTESLPVPELIAKRAGSETAFHIDIAGLSLKGGEIHYYSKRSNMIGRLLQLEVNTGRMTFGQPFDVAFKSKLSGDYPVADGVLEGQGQLSLDPASESYAAQKLNLIFVGELDQLKAQSLTVKGNVGYKSAQRQFSATNLDTQLQGQWLGPYPVSDLNASLSTPKMQINSVSDLVSFEKLGLRIRGKNEGQSLDLALDVPSIQVSPAEAEGEPVVASLKVSGPKVLGVGLTLQGLSGNSQELVFEQAKLEGAIKQGSRVAQLKAASSLRWQPSKEWLRLPDIQASLRVEDEADAGSRFEMPVSGQADLNKGKQEYSAQLTSSTEQAQGSLDVTLQDKGKGPLLGAVLKADKLDLDELRSIFWVVAPEVVTSPEPEVENPEAAAEQEPAQENPEQAEQPQEAQAGAAPAAEEIVNDKPSYAWLNDVRFDLRFEIEKLRSLGMVLEQVKAQVQNQGQTINLTQFNGQGYEGQFQAKAKVEPGKRFELGLKLQKMQVGSLLLDTFGNDYLAGKGDVDLNLKAQGVTQQERLEALEGNLTVDLYDGSWRSVDLDQSVRDINEAVRNAFSGQIPLLLPESDLQRRTVLSRLQGTLDIKKGQASFRNFRATTPILTVASDKGAKLDLVTQQADVVLQARLNHNRLAPDERKSMQDLRNVTIPIHISGPWSNLSYQIQWKEIASTSIKKALQDGLLDLLGQQAVEARAELLEQPRKELESQIPQTVGESLKQWFRP